MEVKPFAPEHLEAVVVLIEAFWRESRMRVLALDAARVRGKLEYMLANPREDQFRVVVCPHGSNQPVGFMAAHVEEYFFCDQRVASSVFLFVSPKARGGMAALKLLLAFRAWARARGAVEMYVGIVSDVLAERTGRFLQRLGMKYTGGNYSLWLSDPAAISVPPSLPQGEKPGASA